MKLFVQYDNQKFARKIDLSIYLFIFFLGGGGFGVFGFCFCFKISQNNKTFQIIKKANTDRTALEL